MQQKCPLSSSPWGAIQYWYEIAPGIISVSTAGHGGIHLDRSRQANVTRTLGPVNTWADGPWYEEDCDWSIPACIFEEEFRQFERSQGGNEEAVIQAAMNTLRNDRPDLYERLYNVKLAPGESRKRDEAAWKEQHKTDWQSVAAVGDWHKNCPKGFVIVSACVGGRNENGRYCGELHDFLVPDDEYDARQPFGFIVDPTRHRELTGVAA